MAGGEAGVRDTLRAMARLIRQDAPHPLVREYAAAATDGIPRADGIAFCEAIRRWSADHFRFAYDPPTIELLHSPEAQVRIIAASGQVVGDCDDAAILAGGLGYALGCGARLVAVSFLDNPNVFRHVWAEISPPTGPGAWIECDFTRQFQHIPQSHIARALVFNVP